jgi:c-di-GMP-binding flagellar brake protein YcgR
MPFKMASVIKFFNRKPLERRKYLRLDARIPVHFFVIPHDQEEEIKKHICYYAHSKNIGGGGLLLEVPLIQDEFFFTTHFIKIELELTGNPKPINAIAHMIAVEKPKHAENYYMRLEFVKINDEDRKKIIDFVHHTRK